MLLTGCASSYGPATGTAAGASAIEWPSLRDPWPSLSRSVKLSASAETIRRTMIHWRTSLFGPLVQVPARSEEPEHQPPQRSPERWTSSSGDALCIGAWRLCSSASWRFPLIRPKTEAAACPKADGGFSLTVDDGGVRLCAEPDSELGCVLMVGAEGDINRTFARGRETEEHSKERSRRVFGICVMRSQKVPPELRSQRSRRPF